MFYSIHFSFTYAKAYFSLVFKVEAINVTINFTYKANP